MYQMIKSTFVLLLVLNVVIHQSLAADQQTNKPDFKDLKDETDTKDVNENSVNRFELLKSPLHEPINDFAFRFLKQLIANDEDQCNIFYSPFSIILMFTMLLHGTDGQTSQQILQTFGYTKSNLKTNEIHQSFQYLLDEISKKQRNYTLNIGSIGLFKEGLNPSRMFRTKLFEDYNAMITNLNFKDKDLATKTLTNWMRTITANKVTKLENNQMTEKTNFILMNAIYFAGKWKHPFNTLNKPYTFYNQIRSSTRAQSSSAKTKNVATQAKKRSENFNEPSAVVVLTDEEKKNQFAFLDSTNENTQFQPTKVEMMGNLRIYIYVKDTEFELIELPYEGDLSMLIFLPNSMIKMQFILGRLNTTYLNQLIDRMDKQKLRLMLPKFKIEQKLDLKHSLRREGLTDLFNENANFQKMFPNQTNDKLFINHAIHNAYIDVDENGTVAFGSTSLRSHVVSGFREIIVQINRPFIFLIKDTVRDVILFSGTLCSFI